MFQTSSVRQSVALIVSLSLCVTGFAQSNVSYFIQAGAYDSAKEASSAQAQLQKSCSPVTILQKDGLKPYKVCVGQFDTYLDAWSNRQKLKKGFPADAFITSGTASGPITQTSLPVDEPFDGPALADNGTSAGEYWDLGGFGNDPEPGPDLADAPPSILNRAELLEAGLSAAKHPFSGVKPLEEFLKRYNDDPKADAVRLRLARVYGRGSNSARAEVMLNKVLRDGTPTARAMARFISAHVKLNRHEMPEAYQAFRAVANDGTLPADLRKQAMWRAAAVQHSVQNYADSWMAYKHIAAISNDSASISDARVQMAGLMFEMVKRSKGTWDEVRTSCQTVINDPQAPHAQRATAELMYLETFYEQSRYDEALRLSNAYIAKYGDVKREAYVALVWKGICLIQLNRATEAKVPLEQVALAEVAPTDKFANTEPSARAAVWLAYVADNEGNSADRSKWVELLKNQYPDGPESRALPGILGTNLTK